MNCKKKSQFCRFVTTISTSLEKPMVRAPSGMNGRSLFKFKLIQVFVTPPPPRLFSFHAFPCAILQELTQLFYTRPTTSIYSMLKLFSLGRKKCKEGQNYITPLAPPSQTPVHNTLYWQEVQQRERILYQFSTECSLV